MTNEKWCDLVVQLTLSGIPINVEPLPERLTSVAAELRAAAALYEALKDEPLSEAAQAAMEAYRKATQ